MTIISTVFVPEGIAMAADSRLTGYSNRDNGVDRYTLTDNAQKIILLRQATIGVSFCGDAIIDGKTIADFLRVFDIERVLSEDRVVDVANKLNRYLAQNYSGYSVAFTLSGYDNDEPFVYSLDKSFVFRKNIENESQQIFYGAFWNGEVEPVSKLFNETLFNFNLMPLKDASDLAEFIAEIAIKYNRFADQIPTCGGPIDILVITKDSTEFYRHKLLKP